MKYYDGYYIYMVIGIYIVIGPGAVGDGAGPEELLSVIVLLFIATSSSSSTTTTTVTIAANITATITTTNDIDISWGGRRQRLARRALPGCGGAGARRHSWIRIFIVINIMFVIIIIRCLRCYIIIVIIVIIVLWLLW